MSLNKRRLCSCRLFVSASFLFFLFLVEKAGIPMQKVSYVMLKVDVEIANICYVLLCLLGNGGCAGVTERRQLHIFLRCVCRRVFLIATSRYISLSVSWVYMHFDWFYTVSAYIFKSYF